LNVWDSIIDRLKSRLSDGKAEICLMGVA
jgi:hypothetical protein